MMDDVDGSVVILAAVLNLRVMTEDDGELLRELTLNPDRDYQPQGNRV